ncbi:transcription factor, MADS-box [Artemisia annua]|uniref:Transcription factor, MADS-box n=1 Tax=Artemisia annua TaxID=35608 RepID=A0A2U1L6D2_ARTAN|nr:transcription factor, MADS-box [Artemisia annua]
MPRIFAGRQKVEMKRIAKQSKLSACFSKRRPNVFKKASELSILCGVDVAVIVFSPNKERVYSFGAPSVEAVLHRCLGQNHDATTSSTSVRMEELRKAKIEHLIIELTNLLAQLESKKKVGEQLKMTWKENQEKKWWTAPIENLGLEELERLKPIMSMLKDKVDQRLIALA